MKKIERQKYCYDQDYCFVNQLELTEYEQAVNKLLDVVVDMCIDMEQYGNSWTAAEKAIETLTGKSWRNISEKD